MTEAVKAIEQLLTRARIEADKFWVAVGEDVGIVEVETIKEHLAQLEEELKK